MTLYEIDKSMREALERIVIDPDTGEVSGIDEVEQLAQDRHDKIEAVALYIKEQTALKAALSDELENMRKRKEVIENRIKRLGEYLTVSLTGSGERTFETARVKIGFRKSVSVAFTDQNIIPPEYMSSKVTFTPDKSLIKKSLQEGEPVPGAFLVETNNIQIK